MITSMPSPKEIGKRISERRAEKDLTLQTIADKVQVQNSTIHRYEKGNITKPKIPVLEAIASALDVTPGYLIDKPDLQLSDYQQQELFKILDSECIAKNITHGLAIVRASVKNDFFPRLKVQKLHNSNMYDILSVARFLGVRLEVEEIINLRNDAEEKRKQPSAVEGLSLDGVSSEDIKTIMAYLEMPLDQRRALAKFLGVSE